MEQTNLIAKDIMDTKIVFIDGLATAFEAAELLKKHAVDMLIISKRNKQDAYGIITCKDLITKVKMNDLDPKETNIYEIMSKPVITIPSDMNVRYIPRLFKRAKISLAPVEEGGQLLGVISYQSLLNCF
ncbi:CBS domain-containing protein [Mongoliitalea daihaiensis]|uniref:CBS domain-containing protein n=1 Tax=Mongoliitalea daihaiensis TaxID=2782006 RepID=UPI001F3A00A7|nr:CBS domain-containing protein [Mongoliitalea daihaiensis]UJP64071.1 CBS domain-containing protein [Mongoliitalea daihaiensis]